MPILPLEVNLTTMINHTFVPSLELYLGTMVNHTFVPTLELYLGTMVKIQTHSLEAKNQTLQTGADERHFVYRINVGTEIADWDKTGPD